MTNAVKIELSNDDVERALVHHAKERPELPGGRWLAETCVNVEVVNGRVVLRGASVVFRPKPDR